MRAIVLMFDSLNRHMISPYAEESIIDTPNFQRLASKTVTFDNFYAGSMPCMPARREMHTGRYNFLHRSWGPLEPFDDSMPEMLARAGIHTHLASDHQHYWEDGGATYHTRYTTWENFRGQEGDPWKGVVGQRDTFGGNPPAKAMRQQDRINRAYMPGEPEHVQTRTVDAGLHFLETNAQADQWMLQIELFDPHEPFFSPQNYRERYGLSPEEDPFDWPTYGKVTEEETDVDHARKEYAALVSLCDHSLGRLLDFMDEHDMWKDTMLIVNTDHGYLLGERGWWAKNMQPWFNELVHLPFFLWDPRHGGAGQRCEALAQTIDLAPTLLRFCGVEATKEMQGQDLGTVLHEELPGRQSALWGAHGAHVNITDGRYIYMRSPANADNQPLEEFTLMPAHMRSRFSTSELDAWEPAEPFSFTKDTRVMRIPSQAIWANAWVHGTQLYDLENDPGQRRPLVDKAVEKRMAQLLTEALRSSDAPSSQFLRLGLPETGPVTEEHLLADEHAQRAADASEPLLTLSDLPSADLLHRPLRELLDETSTRQILQQHAPELFHTELVNAQQGVSLLSLARTARVPAKTLHALGEALAAR